MPRPQPFPIIWQPYAGSLTRREARTYLDQIWSLTVDPCIGVKLRDPNEPQPGVTQWNEFCELRLPNLGRLIYRWLPAGATIPSNRKTFTGALIVVEAVGRHVGSHRDALTRLRMIYATLPDDEGHDKLAEDPCCDDCGDEGRVAETKEGLLQFFHSVSGRR